MTPENESITRGLADWAAGLRYAELPDDVAERARLLTLDAVACAFAGYDADEVPIIRSAVTSLFGSGESCVIGGSPLASAGAAMLNGYLVTAVTACDIYRPATCHITPEVVPAALAAGLEAGADGQAFIAAIAAGIEVTARVGLGLHPPTLRGKGWHAPGVVGPLGAAAAAGSLFGLSGAQLCHALGIAASQAAGTYAQLGTPTIKFHQARGASAGLISAVLAREGIAASSDAIAHPEGGLVHAYSDGGDPDAVLADLGERWELMNVSLRPWPVAVHLQPVVTGVLELVESGLTANDLASLELRISPRAYQMHGEVDWGERFRARLSARYVTAVTLSDAACWLEQFTADRIADPAVGELIRGHIRVVVDPDMRDGSAAITARDHSGGEREIVVTAAKGDPANPLRLSEVEDKYRRAVHLRGVSHPLDALSILVDPGATDDIRTLAPLLSA